MTFTNLQGSFNGLTFGPGSDVGLISITGLRGYTSIRGGDTPRPRRYGSDAGFNELDERQFTATFQIAAPKAPFETVVGQMAAALQNIESPNGQLPFQWYTKGWATPRIVYCRPTSVDLPVDTDYQYQNVQIPVQFTATDPLVYDSVLSTAGPVGLPSPTAGLHFPVTFPVTFGSSTGGSMLVTNSGTETTYPVFTITGPCTNPRLQLDDVGPGFACNISLAATDVLTIDMANHLITLNGTADRLNTIASGSAWFGIAPGTVSITVGSSDSAQVAATFTAQWRSAWGFA
jgi:hypothetical protein